MILYIGNHKESTKRSVVLTNEFNKAAEYKTNTQKSVVVLYTSNEQSKKEIKKTIPHK